MTPCFKGFEESASVSRREAEITDVVAKVGKALDVEAVTKHFYERFQKELSTFENFIADVASLADQKWYASLMLNRMMFIYFIQKQALLDGDPNYLRNRLYQLRQEERSGRFHQFYRVFLLRLFHEGLGSPESERAPDLVSLLGKVPFLNGGLFDVHHIERDNPDISIPDEAFERVFDFFDSYRWHLDERPRHEDNEINPDVLGYIFEKYINQKQMGAYYTRENITGYITRNALIPFLFDAAKKMCAVAFAPSGGVWRLLSDDPDRYIYPSVGHGVAWRIALNRDPKRLSEPESLPEQIAAGLDDPSKRGAWNLPAPETHALPTETWREVIARRRRYQELRARLESGQVTAINDVVTLNLDIERFATDVIVQSEGPELLRAFWQSMRNVSVLDPTCGSGAFLFAAMRILEPLYFGCLDGMQGFVDDLRRSTKPHHPKALSDFVELLERVGGHSSERYFVLKSIVLNNLYGVDIMEEAVEICKLRLFLKLVAQLRSYCEIEPLPDIDFNIRTGNAVVGFTSLNDVRHAMKQAHGQYRLVFRHQEVTLARIEENAEVASRAFDQFRRQQTVLGGTVTVADKARLRARLDDLRSELDHHLATECGIQPHDELVYDQWLERHQPFHWFVEFYSTMKMSGFNVVVGNPPYVQYKDKEMGYRIRGLRSASCRDLYAFCTERSVDLLHRNGRLGLILPISVFGTKQFVPLRNIVVEALTPIWTSNFANRPSQLFLGAQKRISILLGQHRGSGATGGMFSTSYIRWKKPEFATLFAARVNYVPSITPFDSSGRLQKLGTNLEARIFNSICGRGSTLRSSISNTSGSRIYYTRSFGYFLDFLDFVPHVRDISKDRVVEPSELKTLCLSTVHAANAVLAALSSSTFFWFWNVVSDCRNLNIGDVLDFPFNPKDATRKVREELSSLGRVYMRQLRTTSRVMRKGNLEIETFDFAACKPVLDDVDATLAEYFSLGDDELDFLISYDLKYRMQTTERTTT